MIEDISGNLVGLSKLCNPSPCILRQLCSFFPHLLLLLILSLIVGFMFALHFILLHLYLVYPLLYLFFLGLVVLLLLVLLRAIVGVWVIIGAMGGIGETAMIGVHYLPLLHPLMGMWYGQATW